VTAEARRDAIIELLCVRKFTTRENLAFEFHVSKRTIDYDIEKISGEHPIFTVPGNGGGVYIMEGYKRRKKFFTKEQVELLEELSLCLKGEKLQILKDIITTFKLPEKKK